MDNRTSQVAEYLINFYDRFYGKEFESSSTDCIAESPIEKILCAALCIAKSSSFLKYPSPREEDSGRFWSLDQYNSDFFDKIILNKSVFELNKIKYRIDIALYTTGGMKIAIECDGHDFHERTKQQAKHDKERDRWFQSNGWFVARFTGSEIYKDPFEVVSQIGEIVFKWEEKQWRNKQAKVGHE